MYTPIKQLQLGEYYEQIFLIHKSQKLFNRIELELIDVTGRIKAVYWNKISPELIAEGNYVALKGHIKSYKDAKQFSIKEISLAVKPQDTTNYIGGSSDSILSHYAEILNKFLADIDDQDYRDFANFAFNKLGFLEIIKNGPYGLEGPMANKGGLLIHTVHLIQIAKSSIEQFAQNNDIKINLSLVTIGAICRNLGWATTTNIKGTGVEPTNAFHMISPMISSFRMIDHACIELEIPEEKKQQLANICLENPKTIEGQIIIAAEQLTNLMEFNK